ncbi:TetR/AcrR family transcriptional regulator [Nocardia sp. NEAU-G5]|uniref:TetR/AcrR family transcriptional regulator n=1 Tax=Nocardia albiluteola TaxID=2842303 RepID=A0ABS6ATN8_9NOCA|nr:TetR/AcrR family transcriptional regulator [Nocardia albiluteola]MBU3061397.1 TetR/AcrR family transcriptional regulator [Nocardia albiluteola]
MTSSDSIAPTRREQLKAQRRAQLLEAGARLIADRGFPGVRLDDLGAAAGISGPAVYRHFPNKEALLVELLVGISQRLLEGGRTVAAQALSPQEALAGLIDFHLDFALGEPELIRIQDRDLDNLPDSARRQVRRTQRSYVELWVGVLCGVDPELSESTARVQAHATFGLINSTPHSAPAALATRARPVLRAMALAALGQ